MDNSKKSTVKYYRQCVWPADGNYIHHPCINPKVYKCSCKPEISMCKIHDHHNEAVSHNAYQKQQQK